MNAKVFPIVAIAFSFFLPSTASAVMTAVPIFTPKTGVYIDFVDVTISCATAGAVIYYTTDGTDPDMTSDVYSFPLEFEETTTVKAIAYFGEAASAVATETFTVVPAPTPTLKLHGKKKFKTKKSVVKIHGTAANAEEIDYQINDGDYKVAKGLEAWSFKARLKPGKNSIYVYAIGEDEDSDPIKLTVTLAK